MSSFRRCEGWNVVLDLVDSKVLGHADEILRKSNSQQIEFLPRFGGDLIHEGEKGSKVVGHFAKAKIIKSNNK